jgi:hypothetical protein
LATGAAAALVSMQDARAAVQGLRRKISQVPDVFEQMDDQSVLKRSSTLQAIFKPPIFCR